MELKVEIPFQQLLIAVKFLTPAQKVKLKKELTELPKKKSDSADKLAFIEMLVNGPIYEKKNIETIESNIKSNSKWRTKS
jgi:hypothetical protein